MAFCFRLVLLHFQAFKAALVSSVAGRTTLEIFATLSIQISCGCVLLAFFLGVNLDAVWYDGNILCCGGNRLNRRFHERVAFAA